MKSTIIDCLAELGWQPEITFRDGMQETIDWYMNAAKWIEDIPTGEYLNYYKTQYGDRLK